MKRMRTGEYRICPKCQTRNKATQPNCVQCGRPLFGTLLTRSRPLPAESGAAPPGASAWWARWVMVAGLLIAIAFGLGVRKIFRGASLEPAAAATSASASGSEPALPPVRIPVAAATPPPPSGRDYDEGRARLEKGDARGALRLLTPVAQAQPENALVAYTYGRALWASGSRDRAVTQLERAARIDPNASAYRVDLAKALIALRRTREAIREYEAAVSLDPGNADNVMALATLYARAGNSVESRALLQRAATLRPGDPAITQRLADLDARETPTSYTPSAPTAPSASPASSAFSVASASSAASAGVVYTNDDLRRAGTGRTPGAVPPAPPPPVVRPATLGQPAPADTNEASWRGKASERRDAVRMAQQRVDALKARVEDLQRQTDEPAADEQRQERERQLTKALDELDSARERLARAQRRLEEMQDEARRKGIPTDWVR